MRTKFSGFLTLLLVFIVQLGFAQDKTITGTVTDPDGLPLPGATVQLKGKSTGTQTDFDGNYTIKASSSDVLVFTYVGFTNQEKPVGSATTINVTMESNAEELGEVIVTGALGIKRKQDAVTSANEVVKAEKIVQAGNPDAVQSLSGKVSGLVITNTSSGVQDNTRIILRGNRSLTGDNQPLVVIDGAISTISILKAISPNNIENINVIKGAQGSALYGSQGNNGVIVVSTKKGSGAKEKFKVEVRSNVDFQQIAYLPERQTRYGQGWSTGDGWTNYTFENGGWGPEFDGQMVTVGLPQADGSYITRPYSSLGSDNIKDFFQTGITTQNSASISSGSAEGYVNLDIQRQEREFIIENDKLKRTYINFKAGKTLGKWNVSGNATYISSRYNEASTDLYSDLLQAASNIPISAFENSGNEGHWNGYFFNPYWIRDNNRNTTLSESAILIGEIGYQFNDHINALVRSQAQLATSNYLSYANAYQDPQSVIDITGFERTQNSSFQRTSNFSRYYYTDFIVNFDYMLTDDINFKANVGTNNQYSVSYYQAVGGENLTVPGIYSSGNLSNGFSNDLTGDDQSELRKYAFYGQIDLAYKDYLFLNATGRNDWSSALAKNNNNYFYPSVGLSFVPTKALDSWKNNSTLNYLKVLANYTKVGNDGGIGAYSINQRLSQASGFPYNSNSYTLSTSITDPNLNPEFTTTYETAVNAGLFNDLVTLDVAYYWGSNKDLITNITPSYTSGLTAAVINVAETKTSGFEVDLGFNPFKSTTPDQVDWSMNFGYSTNKTIVESVSDQADEVYLGGYSGGAGIYAIAGMQYPQIKGSVYERDNEGHIIVDATSGNPVIATELKAMGRTTPKHIVNFNTSVSWKNFTLSATMDYRTGHVFYSNTKYQLAWSGHLVESAYNRGAFVVPNSVYEDPATGQYVTNTNITTGNTPSAFSQYYSTYYGGVDENLILDATALKLRELTLKYSIPKKLLENTAITSVVISANARNLYTWLPKENRGYADPEANFTTSGNAQGISTEANLPPTRSFGLGLNIIF